MSVPRKWYFLREEKPLVLKTVRFSQENVPQWSFSQNYFDIGKDKVSILLGNSPLQTKP